jgi:hypothetical protein
MDDFKTDNLGTFSGNTSGKDPLTTLRAKCDQGRAHSNYDLVIANEALLLDIPVCFADADDSTNVEDYKNNIEIVAETQFKH